VAVHLSTEPARPEEPEEQVERVEENLSDE